VEEKEGPDTSGPDEAHSAEEALWARWNTHAVSEAEEATRAEEAPVEETTRGEELPADEATPGDEPPADEVELARRVAHEAAVRHADIARQLERMAQVAEDAAGQAAHAREEDEAARTAEARRVEEAERAAQAASEAAAQRVEEAERAAQAAREAAARREETLLQAQHLAARVRELASRAEASRREVEAALREANELFEARQAPEAREEGEARQAPEAREEGEARAPEAREEGEAHQASEAREEGEARQAAVVPEENEPSLTKRTFRRTRKGATGEASLRLAPPDRVVVIPEVPSAPSEGESEGALPIGQAPKTRRARRRIPGFLRRGHRHRKLNLTVLAVAIAAVIAGVIAGVVPGVLTGTLFQGDLPSEQSPATEVSGEESGIVVPELAGLTASQAREVLVTVNLRVGGINPVQGEPGVVAGTRPVTGEVVRPGEAVTLLIGVESDRLERESAWGTPR
jgi:hypothetical protein